MDKPTLAEAVERVKDIRVHMAPDVRAALARLIEVAERVQDDSPGAKQVWKAAWLRDHHDECRAPRSGEAWNAALAWARGER